MPGCRSLSILLLLLVLFGGQPVTANDTAAPSESADSSGGGSPSGNAEPPSFTSESPGSAAPSAGGKSAEIPSMYGEQFKCSDGYNPDTDPSLHPPGQDPKVRMQVNAQAQKAYEDRLAAEKEAVAQPSENENSEARKAEGAPPEADRKPEGEREDKKTADKAGPPGEKDKARKPESLKPEVVKLGPVKEALFLIQSKQYQESAAVLTAFLSKNSQSIDGHYLLAVSYVGLRKYDAAAEQYRQVMALAPGTKHAELAAEGLRKISH